MLLNLLESFPKIARDIKSRTKNKEINRAKALEFGHEYFDGSRNQGYGGYYYDGRWVKIAKKLQKIYRLKDNSKILDIGCAKGYLLFDLKNLNPKFQVYGLDISEYAINNSDNLVRNSIIKGNCKELPFRDNYFDLVISINTVHNLKYQDCKEAIKEIIRVSNGKSFIQVDAYRNDEELELFKEWMLTAKTYLKPDEWIKLFHDVGYKGDYYWTILKFDGDVV